MNPEQLQAAIDAAVAEVTKTFASAPKTAPDDVQKTSLAIATGIYAYDLEPTVKTLAPFLPTWFNRVPREVGNSGNQHEYDRITKISITGKSTAAEGTVGNAAAFTKDRPTVTYGILSSGLFDVTWEAERAAAGYDDLRARAITSALLLGRRNEVAHAIGGTRSALGAVDASVAVSVADNTGVTGTLANAAHYVYIKALNGPAMQKAILAGACVVPDGTNYTAAGLASITVDQTDGWGIESTVASATPTLNKGLTIIWQPVPGACGYGVFVGTSTGITNCKLQFVVGQCKVVLTTLTTSSSAGVSGDNSADTNGFVGLLGLMVAGSSYSRNVGAALTPATGNGIPEIDTMLSQCYASALGVDSGRLICGITDLAQITRKLGAGAAYSLYRYNLDAGANNTLTGGAVAVRYIHPVTGKPIPIEVDPTLYGGNVIWLPDQIPYPNANVPAPTKMWLSYEWTNFEYAITAPTRRYENRMRGGLALYLPTACGFLYNVWNG